MTTDLLPVESSAFLDECKNQYLGMTPDQRLGEAKQLYLRGIENAFRLVALVWAAKERGDDLEPLKEIVGDAISVYLELAYGRLTLEAFRTWGRKASCLMLLKRLTPADQRRCCEGSIPVFERANDGTPTQRQLPLDEIVKSDMAAQVFDRNTIRSVAEQEAWLKREERKKNKKPKWETFGAFEMNDENEEAEPVSRRPYAFAEIEALYKECKRRGWGKK